MGHVFERCSGMSAKVVFRESAGTAMRHHPRRRTGLWWSGLRLAESLELYWDRQDKLSVDMTGRRLMLRIPAKLEKGHRDRLLAMAPEFAEFLERTPPEERTGRVFNLKAPSGRTCWVMRSDTVSNVVCRIGRKANVKVEETPRKGEPYIKYASAHDLRRSFGERWAMRVLP